jgi:alkylation response protein AidB-like acyl-CoA dehydrogenase
MRRSSFLAATVPAAHGGLGVTSLHDLMVGVNRLARGDASTAIAVNMHLTGVLGAALLMDRSRTAGEEMAADVLRELLIQVGRDDKVMCFPLTEAGTDHTSPRTEATPTRGGYLINGRKTFATISPAADLFLPTVRVPKPEGGFLTATAVVPTGTPGLTVEDNWDSLGMRASGSHDITFTDCFVPTRFLIGQVDSYGSLGPGYLASAMMVHIPLLGAFLGIAEAAREYVVAEARIAKNPGHRSLSSRASVRLLMAQMDIALAECRGMLDRVSHLVDDLLNRPESNAPDIMTLHRAMKEVQCAKYVVNRRSVEIVDHAMTIIGGRAYLGRNILSRLYRDARAGGFMQPFSPVDALEYIGKVSFDLVSALE